MANTYDLTDTSLGLWVDLPKRQVLTQNFFDWFVNELKFDEMSIMIDQPNRDVDFSWGERDIEKALELADRACVEIGLTVWFRPDLENLIEMREKLKALLAVGPIAEVEGDLEFNWKKHLKKGFASFITASRYLSSMLDEFVAEFECRTAVTTVPEHKENGPTALISSYVDRLLAQAYAIANRNGRGIAWGHRYGPGRMQKMALDRSLTVPQIIEGKPKIGVGLAAWSQFFEGSMKSPAEAMQTSFEACLSYTLAVIKWWSAKFAYPGSVRHKLYAEKFLKSLRAE
jgi:hypothetical protein